MKNNLKVLGIILGVVAVVFLVFNIAIFNFSVPKDGRKILENAIENTSNIENLEVLVNGKIIFSKGQASITSDFFLTSLVQNKHHVGKTKFSMRYDTFLDLKETNGYTEVKDGKLYVYTKENEKWSLNKVKYQYFWTLFNKLIDNSSKVTYQTDEAEMIVSINGERFNKYLKETGISNVIDEKYIYQYSKDDIVYFHVYLSDDKIDYIEFKFTEFTPSNVDAIPTTEAYVSDGSIKIEFNQTNDSFDIPKEVKDATM